MSSVLIIGTTWLLLAVVVALLVGGAIRRAAVAADEVPDVDLDQPSSAGDLPPARTLPSADGPFHNPDSPAPAPGQSNGPATVPGIPAARPRPGRPPVPPSSHPGSEEYGIG